MQSSLCCDRPFLACTFGQRYRTLATSQENIRSGETVYKNKQTNKKQPVLFQCVKYMGDKKRKDKDCDRFHETWETRQLNARWDTGLDSG